MKQLKKNKLKRIMWIVLSVILLAVIGIYIFINTPRFGRLPQNERLERIKMSPNYKDGSFKNLHETPQITSDKGFVGSFFDFLFKKNGRVRPKESLPSIKTDLLELDKTEDVVVWFGHSSYFMQIEGKRILVDPVFSEAASPVSFFNKAFKGTNVYSVNDMPDIDYLIISHDHWDHLDYPTVKALKERIGKVVCGLGVGEHFERWGFDKSQLIELDWDEDEMLDNGVMLYCLPARHFSGRGLSPNQSLWASFLLKFPTLTIYVGGDSGYDTFFKEIGNKFEKIDLAILENGQYDKDWKYIHMMPEEVIQAAKDLNARKLIPVHNSKFALGNHAWDDPLIRVAKANITENLDLITPIIGEKVNLNDSNYVSKRWWKNIEQE